MGEARGLAVADDDVGRAVEDRPHEARDVGAGVLVVAVGVDDDIGAEPEAGVDAGAEGARQALVVLVADDVVDADLARHRDRAVGRAVVDDEDLDRIDAVDRARNVGDGLRQRRLFIETRNLYDQLHLHSARRSSLP